MKRGNPAEKMGDSMSAVPNAKISSSPSAGAMSSRALFKNMLRGSGIYSLAFIGQQLVGIALVPIKTNFLLPADYGVLGLLEKSGIVLAALLGVSFPAAIGYFYFQTEDEERRRQVVMTSVLGAGILGLLALFICWPFAPALSRLIFQTEAMAFFLLLVFLGMPLNFLLEALLGWLRVENRQHVWLLGSMARLGVTLAGVTLFLAVFRMRVVGVQYAALAAAGIPMAILAVYFFRRNHLTFDVRLFLRMARFALPLGLGGIAMFLIHSGDQFILVRYVSLTELGLYSFAYTIGMLVSAVYGSFQIYWGAQVYQILKRDDADAVFARVFTYISMGVVLCGFGMIAFSRPAFRLLATPAYEGALALIPLLVIAYCIRSFGEFFRSLFLVEGRPGYDAACTWIACATCLTGYALLIPRFGVWGAVAATVITFVVFSTVIIFWTYRLRRFSLEPARLVKIGATLTIVGGGYALLPVSSWPAQAAWAALLVMAFPALLWVMRFFTPGEMQVAGAAARAASRLITRTAGN
jgi:O-antigen/teichoic acid export membrane protein